MAFAFRVCMCVRAIIFYSVKKLWAHFGHIQWRCVIHCVCLWGKRAKKLNFCFRQSMWSWFHHSRVFVNRMILERIHSFAVAFVQARELLAFVLCSLYYVFVGDIVSRVSTFFSSALLHSFNSRNGETEEITLFRWFRNCRFSQKPIRTKALHCIFPIFVSCNVCRTTSHHIYALFIIKFTIKIDQIVVHTSHRIESRNSRTQLRTKHTQRQRCVRVYVSVLNLGSHGSSSRS